MPPEKTKTTIYDVAEHAGVAISTVSRVLNNSSDVSEPTRARVLKAIEDLQFRPDRTAKALAQKQTRLLAIAIPTFTTPFHNELLKGVRHCLREESNSDLLLCDLGSTSTHRSLLDFLQRGTVDGLLLAGVPVNEKIAQELKALSAPVVLVGAHHTEFDSFYWDDTAGAHAAIDHLIAQGHRRIGMITAYTQTVLQDYRIRGYQEALEQAGLSFSPDLIKSGDTKKHAGFSEEAGHEAMQELLALDPPVTAVFASSDVQAIGAWKAIRDAGRRVPDDIAIVGYDDIKTSQYIGLSSVDQDMHEVGREATDLLLQRINGNHTLKTVDRLITPQLIVRESSIHTVE